MVMFTGLSLYVLWTGSPPPCYPSLLGSWLLALSFPSHWSTLGFLQ